MINYSHGLWKSINFWTIRVALALSASLSYPILADENFSLNLWIELDRESLTGNPTDIDPGDQYKSVSEKWSTACQLLAHNLKNSKADFRSGVFDSTTCIFGNRAASENFEKSKQSSAWLLRFRDDQGKMSIKLYHYYYGRAHLEAVVHFSNSDRLIDALQEDKISKILTFAIMDQMPILHQLSLQGLQTLIESDSTATEGAQVFEEYVIYEMSLKSDPYQWIPRPIGFAKKQGDEVGNRHRWELDLHKDYVMPGKTYYVHNAEGRNQKAAQTIQDLNRQLSRYDILGFLDFAFSQLNPSFAGVRVGIPVIKDPVVISDSYLVSTLLELNFGPAKGLRWYWDVAPLVKRDEDGLSTYFSWHRTSFGKSFEFPQVQVLSQIFEHVDIVPRLGLMSLDANLPMYESMEDELIASDNLIVYAKNVLDLGVEFGASHQNRWMRLRLWTSINYGGFLSLAGGRNVDVQSLRGGVDSYFHVFTGQEQWRFQPFVFAFGETLKLKGVENLVSELEQFEMVAIEYKLNYFGGGVTFQF